MFTNRSAPNTDLSAAAEAIEAVEATESLEYLPLTLVAAELAELGLSDPAVLEQHVGPDKILRAAGLVRCISVETVAELVDELEEVRERRAEVARRNAEQLQERARQDLDAEVRAEIWRERVTEVQLRLGCDYVTAAQVVNGERTADGYKLADEERVAEMRGGGQSTFTYHPIGGA